MVNQVSASTDKAESASQTRGRRLRKWIDQIGAILLAVLLAAVIWLIAVSQRNPLITQDLPQRLPVTVRGLDAFLQPVQDLGAEQVRVTVRAPQNAWDDLTAGDFVASVDLTGLAAGTHDVPVQVDVNDPRITILDRNPPNIRVQLDPLVSKMMSVTVQVLDAPAFGYDAQQPVVEPATITIQGPSSQVELVTQVVAPVMLLNAKNQVERTVDLRLVNRQNQQVDSVIPDASVARVVVPVEQWPGRKEVAVRINLVGQPAPGYRLSTVRAEPSTVVLQGDSAVLESVPGYIETAPLSIDNATSELRQRLDLVVPQGASVFDGDTVQTYVSITPIEGGTTMTVRPIVQGLGPGLNYSVSLETVDVILSGPIPLLESLNSDDMLVILDLSGLLPGTHVIPPRVVLPEGIRREGALPEMVEVVITQAAIETPSSDGASSPLPTPTATSIPED
jgi:YbbR domain-containing protein